MSLGPPIRKEQPKKEYDECWKQHPENPSIEVNTIDGKMRSKEFDPFEDIARRKARGEFDESTADDPAPAITVGEVIEWEDILLDDTDADVD